MSEVKLRAEIKKAVDHLPPDRLASLADYVSYLARPSIEQRVNAAEKALKAGKAVNWRKLRTAV